MRARPDAATLIAISALAYVAAVALHEHLGHATACVLLGSRPTELGAFFVNCDDTRLSDGAVRAVALAGPLVSLLSGGLSWALLSRVPVAAPRAFYFLWLLGALGLMDAAGYPLFSGIAGIGDLGTGDDGALRAVQPAWLWRVALAAVGVLGYRRVVIGAVRRLALRLPGGDPERARAVRGTLWVSYLTGAVVYLGIGLLNPYGALIVFESVLPSSLGGTSGLVWMVRLRTPEPSAGDAPGLGFERSGVWIAAGVLVTLVYAALLGRR